MILYSYYIQHNLDKLNKHKEGESAAFKEKLFIYTNNAQQKQLGRILIATLVLAISLIVVIFQQLGMGITDQKLKSQVEDLQGTVTNLDNGQTTLLAGLPITPYNAEKVKLQDFKWDTLFSDERKTQLKQESNLAQLLMPYFGYYQTMVTISTNPQVLTMTFVIGKRTTWWLDVDDNLRLFFQDLASKTKLTDVVIQTKDTAGTVTKATYSRKVGDTSFNKSLEQRN